MVHRTIHPALDTTRFVLEVAVPFLLIATAFCTLLWPHATLAVGVLTAVAVALLIVNVFLAPRIRDDGPVRNPWLDLTPPDEPVRRSTPPAVAAASGSAPAPERDTAARDEEIRSAELRAGLGAALAIFAVIVVLAFGLALVLFGWKLAFAGSLLIALYMALVGWPCWLTAIEEQEEFAHERETGEVRSIH